MPNISQRGVNMPASPIRKLVPLANQAKAKGIKVYHLNIGQPDVPTPEVAMEAMRHIDRTVLEYSPSEGIRSFREKLVKYYAKFNILVDADDIIITTGGSEAVFFSFMACLDPGDEIIVPEPAYANYMAFAISCGAVIKTIPSTIDEGFALPSVERFEELITPRTKAILICNPNNPTGYLYTQKEMNQIRDIVKKYDLFLFSDEVYREFCYTGAPYISAFHLEGIENNVVLVDSVSKRYSECGIRIGALITKNQMVKENVMKWCQARLSPPLIGQIIAEASLDTPNDYMLNVYNDKDKVPPEWIRKQTLVNAERYITQELKEYEEKILGAEDKILVLETQLYTDLVQALMEFIPQIQINANQIARLDCLLSFANVARENRYVRPIIEDNDVLDIRQGRHPVIEKQLPIGEKYIANDVMLDSDTQQIIIITGPNMAGKSALLRQTALITLLAQIGSFVPAESAHIGLVDKIFTRVGASDNISVGESTFMVEMNEAADILNNVSSRSLVLFDELGRGTSTYDGISIAWAIVEYIHEHPKAKARTLFATHYHELNEMEKSFKRIKNYNVSVKEVDNKVIFLRKLERGGSEHSFGIHVAKMAGMPKSIVKRANEILKQLESDNRQQGIAGKPLAEVSENRGGMQLSFFQLDDPILCQIRDEILNLDVNNLTPIEALNKLNDIKKIVRGK